MFGALKRGRFRSLASLSYTCSECFWRTSTEKNTCGIARFPFGSTAFLFYDTPVWQTDGRTDGRAIAYTRYSIYAVARKNGLLLLNRTKTAAVLFGSRAQRDKTSTADDLNVTGTVVPFREVAWCHTGLWSDDGPTRHWSTVQLSHSCTASHPSSANTRYCQDDHTLCCLIAAGLRQYTTARHVLSATNLNKLQMAQNTLARVMCSVSATVVTQTAALQSTNE